MGHGRKKDQGSHHRRHKSSSSNASTGQKPADDPFYELQVVDEHLVWITWDELLIVSAILIGLITGYVYFYYQDLEASIALLERSTRSTSRRSSGSSMASTSRTTSAFSSPDIDYIDTSNNVRATIAEQSIERDDFLQLVEDDKVIVSDKKGELWSCPPDKEMDDDEDYYEEEQPPNISFDDFTDIRPHLCSDGKTYGYDTYQELEDIMSEINSYSHDRYVEWDSFYERTSDTFDGQFEDRSLYFDEEIVVRICPNTVLKRRKGPALYLNAENVLVECDDCVMEVKSGSHMIFGPYAQDVMVRGIHFRGATETSVRFPYDGAEVYFEDCYFSHNGSRGKHIGTVADVNSTSSVDFLRCLMEKDADGVIATSSLSIRTKGDDG